MDTLNIAEEGVTLNGAPGFRPGGSTNKPTLKPLQAMRLELEDGVLDNILRTARSGGKGVHLSFGKTIVSRPNSGMEASLHNIFRMLTPIHRHSITGTDPNNCRPLFSLLRPSFTATPKEKKTRSHSQPYKVTAWP